MHCPQLHLSSFLIAFLGVANANAQEPEPDPEVALDTIWVNIGSRVSAVLPVATRAVEVMTAEELEGTPARTVADLLRLGVGVDVLTRSPAQADVSVRGGSAEKVLILVDGVRMSDAQTAHFDLDLAVPLEQVQRVEILRGPGSSLYGSDAVGGIINIVTRRGESGVDAHAEGGSFGTAGIAASGYVGEEVLGARVVGAFRRSDGHRSGTDYRIAHAYAAVDARIADRNLRADVAFAARDFGADGFYGPYPSYEETRVATASLAWLAPGDTRWAVEPRLNVRPHHDDFVLIRDDPAVYENIHTSWQFGGELVGRYIASPAARFVAGAEAYRDVLRSTNLGDREESRVAGFAELAAGRIGYSTLNLGLRVDWHSAYGTFATPSLAAALWPADRLRVHASTARSFRAPSWTERYYRDPTNVGNSTLEPEVAWGTELGVDVIPVAGTRVGVTGFTRAAEALIDWVKPAGAPADSPYYAANLEEATFYGLEFRAEAADLFGARWTLRATGLSFEAGEAAGMSSKYALRPLVWTVSLSFDRRLFAGLSLSARALHASREGDDPYVRADARLAYAWERLRLYLDMLNVGDDSYLDASRIQAPGRAAYLGLEWSR